jgi:hypothetical protein
LRVKSRMRSAVQRAMRRYLSCSIWPAACEQRRASSR